MTQQEEQAVVRRARPAAADVVLTVIASVAIAIPLIFHLHEHVEILRLGYEIESLEERRVALAERSLELRIERLEVASLPRVEEQAAALGLVAPDPTDVYVAGGASPPASPVEVPRVAVKLE